MQSVSVNVTSVKASSNRPQSFCAVDSGNRQSCHSAEGLTAEDKRLFLGARLRVLYRKLSRNSPITREELAALAAYASDSTDEIGVAA
jgi:hypothetical protein